jgi:BASS family bile acid:Na+ symporter
MKIVLPVLLAIAMLGAVLVEKSDMKILPTDYSDILPFVLALNFLGLAGGYFIAKQVKLGNRNKLTVSMEVGLQNTGMAISIATSPFLLNDKSFAVPAAIYALFSFFTALMFAAWIKRKTVKAYLARRFGKS